MLPRQWLVSLSAGVNVSIWYNWHDDGADPNEPEFHFGAVSFDYRANRNPVYEPKPAYSAARTLLKTLAGYRFDTSLKVRRMLAMRRTIAD